MKNVKEILNVTKEGFTIKSTDLVDIINKFRKEEGRKVELQHKSFMAKIRKELEILEKLGLKGEQNILPTYYLDKQGLELDYNKKTYLWLKYDCLPKFDAGDNFIKAFKDELARAYNVDDKNIMLMRSDVNEFVNSYSDGKIYYIIRQAREDC